MDIRKLFVYLVLSIFLVGIFPAGVLAERGSDSGSGSTEVSVGVDASVKARTAESDDDTDDDEAKVSSSGAKISEEEAKEIAVKETGGTVTDVDTDRVKGKAAWEIEIQKDGKEADVLIDMETGAVLAVEWEDDDDADDAEKANEGKLDRMEEKFKDIRERQRSNLEGAEKRCAESKNPEGCKRAIENRQEALAKLEEKDLERLEKLQEKRADIEEKMKELKKGALKKFDDEGKSREIAKAKKEEAEKKLKEAKERFEESHKKQKDVREKFVDAREEWKEKCKDADTDECTKLAGQLKSNVKEYLARTLESISSELEQLKSSVQSSETLSEEEAAAALKDVDALLTRATELTTKVNGLSAESVQKDIDALVKEVRALWKDAKHPLKLHAVKVVNSRLGGVLVKSERMKLKLAHVLERMTEKGVDTAIVEGLVTQFNEKLAAAEESYKSSQALLKEAARLSGEKRAEKVQEAHAMLKKAQASLKEAHELLKDIHNQLKKQRQTELLAEVEADTALTVG